jgi:hypothetical protein
MTRRATGLATLVLLWCCGAPTFAQSTAGTADGSQPPSRAATASPETSSIPSDSRTQFPAFLLDSYFGVDVGSINYPFSPRQLESGFRAESVAVPHAAARVVLFGHRFYKYLSAQIAYTRPVQWVKYRNVNGTAETGSVWMAIGDVSLKSQLPVTSRVAVYGETGLALVSRTGFAIAGAPGVAHAQYGAPLFGAGIEYALNTRWDVLAGMTYVPSHGAGQQPEMTTGSLGFRYNVRPIPAARVEAARTGGGIFPENLVQLGIVTNTFGYGWNNVVSSKAPVFWGGHVQVARGLTVRYQRNVFHTRRRLALDLGTSVSLLKSEDGNQNFVAVAAYPLVRWNFLRREAADVFVSYSVAGPSFVSRRIIGQHDAGNRFTFQDMLGVGMFVGRSRHLFVQLDIGHYSNGNMFPQNPGVKVPTTITFGRAF